MPETIRRRIIRLLQGGPHSCRDISQTLGISEKEVLTHLPHIARTAGRAFTTTPARCRSCDFTFRPGFSRPGKCPRCRKSFIESPSFTIRTD